MLSHELRTPLTPVLAAGLGLWRTSRRRRGRAPRSSAMIRRNVELEARLIDDLLDLTRIARGKLDAAPRGRRPSTPVLEHAMRDAAQRGLADKRLRLVIDLAADGPPRLGGHPAADPGLLEPAQQRRQVHARRAARSRVRSRATTPAGPRTRRRGRGHRDRHRARRAAAHLRRLRAGRSRRSPAGSAVSGWGWRSARRSSRCTAAASPPPAHGRGRGATFIVRLPVAGDLRRPPAARGPTPAGTPRPADRARCASSWSRTTPTPPKPWPDLLRELGHRGHGGRHRRRRRSPRRAQPAGFDLVISDLGLPDGSGLDLMRELHRPLRRARHRPLRLRHGGGRAPEPGGRLRRPPHQADQPREPAGGGAEDRRQRGRRARASAPSVVRQ